MTKISNYVRPGSAGIVFPSTPGGTGGTLGGGVTDGTTTVAPASTIDFTSGATVTDLGGGIAGVAVTGGISGIEVANQGGSPDTTGITKLVVPNGMLGTSGTTATVADQLSTVAASGAAQTLDLRAYSTFDITLTANCTLTYSNPPPSGDPTGWTLILRQGGTGSYSVTWPAAQKWQAANGTMTGSAPTLHTTVAAEDIVVISTVDGGTTYGGVLIGAGGASPASTVIGPDAYGAAAVVGTSLLYARGDHDHGLPAAPAASDHEHVMDCLFSGDGSTVAWTLPAAPFDAYSVAAYVAGVLTEVTLSGAMLDTATFGSAPASATNNIRFDIVAAVT
jgi:hypothetical protein